MAEDDLAGKAPTLTCQAIAMELAPEVGGAKMLVATVDVNCPICGRYRMVIHGHHVRNLRDFLTDVIERYPELTPAADASKVSYNITGPGNNPSDG